MAIGRGLTVVLVAITCLHLACAEKPATRHLSSFLDGINNDLNNKINFVGTVLNQQLGQDAKSQQYGYGQQQQQDAQIQGLLNKQQSNNRHLLSFLDGIDQDVNNKLNLVGTVLNQQLGQDAKSQQYGYGGQQQQDAQIQGLLNKQQSNNRHLLSFLDSINQDVNNKLNYVGTVLNLNKGNILGQQQQQDSQIQDKLAYDQQYQNKNRHLLANKRRNLASFLPDLHGQQNAYGTVHQKFGQQIQGEIGSQIANQLGQDQQIQSTLDNQLNNLLINPINSQIVAAGSAIQAQLNQDAQIQQNLFGGQQAQDAKIQGALGQGQQAQDAKIQGALGQDQQNQDAKIQSALGNDQQSQDAAIQGALAQQQNQDAQIQGSLGQTQQGRRLSEIERAQAERARILKSIFGDGA